MSRNTVGRVILGPHKRADSQCIRFRSDMGMDV
jgi:hypothetical protein